MTAETAGQKQSDVKYEEEFIVNSRGIKQFTCRWLPVDREAKGLICLCHGYCGECSIGCEETGVRLAKTGYAVFGIDHEGHGKSDGVRGYVKSFDNVVNDCASFFHSISERTEYAKKVRFLYGASMGGAVALLLHRKQPTFWNGAVLLAPMCKIGDEVKPHPLLVSVLKKLAAVVPKWKIIPSKDMMDIAIKDPETRKKVSKFLRSQKSSFTYI
uniref:Serine aminopeptidase S33 domain-containing protein n=1 Tax=Araucaria cunninghamii TaxID=56994 RepID=A0A0D6R2E4_ARACU